MARDFASCEVFLQYLKDASLEFELSAVCFRYRVTLQDIYLDKRDKPITWARLTCWWWLSRVHMKSHSAIARLFDRDNTSVHHGLAMVEGCARALGVTLDRFTIYDVVPLAERKHGYG